MPSGGERVLPACNSTIHTRTVVPVPPLVAAPLPPANSKLPPVPTVLGPVQISVVYPKPEQMLTVRDSNFIFGSVEFAGGRGAATSGGIGTTGAGADGPVAGLQDALATARQQVKTLNVEPFISGL